MNENEIKKAQLAKMVKFGLVGLFCVVAAPVAWMAVTGIAGMLAALGVAAVGYNLAPVVALKLANAKYRALDSERVSHIIKVQDAAAENPIETLQLEYDSRVKSTDRFAQGITDFRTEIKNYADQVKQFETEYPDDAQNFRDQLLAMKSNLAAREEKYKTVQAELVKFDNTIKRMRAMWKMAIATQKMNRLAGMNTGDEFARIKTEAAVDSVMSGVNKAFAEMETELMVNKKTAAAPAALENRPSETVFVEAVISQKEKV